MPVYVFIIPFIFGNTGFYVNENGLVSLHLGLQFFKSNELSIGQLSQLVFVQLIHLSPY